MAKAAYSTVPDARPLERLRSSRASRRIFIALLFIFLALGLAGVLGVRTGTVSATGGGYEIEVEFARVTRPGLATPWSTTVRHPGGFDGPITIAVSSEYFDMFDENGLDPDPDGATADGEFVYWEFQPPAGDVFEVSFDARIEPARQWGREGVSRLMDGETVLAEARYRTWVLP
jgi:hypothetical protein